MRSGINGFRAKENTWFSSLNQGLSLIKSWVSGLGTTAQSGRVNNGGRNPRGEFLGPRSRWINFKANNSPQGRRAHVTPGPTWIAPVQLTLFPTQLYPLPPSGDNTARLRKTTRLSASLEIWAFSGNRYCEHVIPNTREVFFCNKCCFLLIQCWCGQSRCGRETPNKQRHAKIAACKDASCGNCSHGLRELA